MAYVRMQQRRDTTAVWQQENPVLAEGEIGFDTTVNRLKVGNGITTWLNLPYADRAEEVASDAASVQSALTEIHALVVEDLGTTDAQSNGLIRDPSSLTYGAVAAAGGVAADSVAVKRPRVGPPHQRFPMRAAPAADTIWIGAAQFNEYTGVPSREDKGTGAGGIYTDWRMPNSGDSTIETSFMLPPDWTAYIPEIYYTGATSVTADTAYFYVTRTAHIPGEQLSSGTYASGHTSPVPATAGVLAVATIDNDGSEPFSINGGPFANSTGFRDALHTITVQRVASDNYTGDVRFLGMRLRRAIAPLNLVADGNSLIAGTNNGGSTPIPTLVANLLTRPNFILPPIVTNKGVGGQQTPQMSSDADTDIDPLRIGIVPGISADMLMVWEGTNNIYFGATGTAAYQAMRDYCTARQTNGWQVVVGTIMPRAQTPYPNSWTVEEFEAHRQTFNTLLRENWPAFADGLADIAADPRIGAPGTSLDYTYFEGADPAISPPGVHLKPEGEDIAAQIFAETIRDVMGRPY